MIESILSWYSSTKRDLPWRHTHDPYRIWVSEIFLQQTQASRVIDFYTRFLERFPTVQALSQSSWEEFLPYFQGLGFYSRGRNMLKTAQKIVLEYNGGFPNDARLLQTLPGVGAYTAAAIQSFAYGESVPALDVNLFRVMGRYWGILDTKEITKRAKELYAAIPHGDLLNHAFMDLGSTHCLAKKTFCEHCPLHNKCDFFVHQKTIERDLSPKAPLQKYNEYSVMVLRHEGKYLLEKKDFYWSLPMWGNTSKQDHRHFLQEQAKQTFGVVISVRPPFYTIAADGNRYKFSRCQILSGNTPDGEWKTPDCITDLVFPPVYSEEFISKWCSMRV